MGSSIYRKAVAAAAFIVAFSVLSTAPALACPNCFSAKENVLWAYYSTAIGLSLLPFALFGGIALYWYKKRGQTPFSQE
jgi:hypothetical protein